MPRENEQSFLSEVLRGNQAAIAFINILFKTSQVLDDLIDGDKAVNRDTLLATFWMMLVELPNNPFYSKHFSVLNPLVMSAMQDYVDSVALEGSENQRHRHVAFVLRDQLTSVVVQCANLVGGYAWMRRVSLPIRDHFHEDEFSDYERELPAVKAARKAEEKPEAEAGSAQAEEAEAV